jgi:hypothetical protein
MMKLHVFLIGKRHKIVALEKRKTLLETSKEKTKGDRPSNIATVESILSN